MYAFVYYILFLLSVIVYIINRYEKDLPGIDIFVCTADPVIEPPVMVINTILSVMAYDYPPEKLNVYLSDDGGSDLTFYAMLEASRFSKIWLPFCKRFEAEPRSPEAYFRTAVEPLGEPVMPRSGQLLRYFSCYHALLIICKTPFIVAWNKTTLIISIEKKKKKTPL